MIKAHIEYTTWVPKTWNGYNNIEAQYIWTDGSNIYHSDGSNQYNPENRQYVLDKSTSKWSRKIWNNLSGEINGSSIWSDGTDIYYSKNVYNHFVLDKSTSTWNTKRWNVQVLSPLNIWTDGSNIYHTLIDGNGSYSYVLDKSTSTWNPKTWYGFSGDFFGQYVWTDGSNIYYSFNGNENIQYVLDKSTSTWNPKTWYGNYQYIGSWYTSDILDRRYIWTDGDNIYLSYYFSDTTYVQSILDKSTSTWNTKTWNGYTGIDGRYIWTDGDNIYYSDGNTSYILTE